ncbi:hypothetical protein [Paenibacillus gallinarum]|nr:hypothetical protein [Paenibacillus gallinarum]
MAKVSNKKETSTTECGKGLANNEWLPTKPGIFSRTDDFAVTATPL